MRIPATIEVFDVVEAARSVWEAETAGVPQNIQRKQTDGEAAGTVLKNYGIRFTLILAY